MRRAERRGAARAEPSRGAPLFPSLPPSHLAPSQVRHCLVHGLAAGVALLASPAGVAVAFVVVVVVAVAAAAVVSIAVTVLAGVGISGRAHED